MSLRGRSVGVVILLTSLLGAALALGLGSASAQPKPSPFRTAQGTAPCPPEPPLVTAPVPPPPPPPAVVAPPPGTACPVDPPTPAVSIRVRAPASAGAGEELEYRIVVQNTARAAAHHVTVRNPLPAHAKFIRATPKPDQAESELLWRLGTLDACATREIVLVLSPTGTGDVNDCARVQFEHGQCVTTHVTRPQLVVRKTGPTEARLDEALTFRITVTNTGAAAATGVELEEQFTKGWQYAQVPFNKDEATLKTWPLGTIGPGQTQTVEYQVTPRVTGTLGTSALVTAAGGITTEPVKHTVVVGSRTLTLEIEGPRTAYARRAVNFFLAVKNDGTLPAADVVVTNTLPEGLDFVEANQGGRYADNQIRWALGTLAAGQSRILRLRVQSDAEREVRQMPMATAAGGLKASTELTTKFQGAAGFDFDVDASDYAVEVGTAVRYKITVFNRGTGAQTNVRILAELPPEMEFKEARAPGGAKVPAVMGMVRFAPLPALAANSEVTYEIDVVARRVDDARALFGMAAGAGDRFTYKAVPIQVGEKQPP